MINTLDHLKGKWELNGDGEDMITCLQYYNLIMITCLQYYNLIRITCLQYYVCSLKKIITSITLLCDNLIKLTCLQYYVCYWQVHFHLT
jgi:hypothetical protein